MSGSYRGSFRCQRAKDSWRFSGSKQLAGIQGDDAPARSKKALLLLLEGDDNVAADTRHTLDALDLGPVVEAQPGGR